MSPGSHRFLAAHTAKAIQRDHDGILPGPLMFRWTTCVRLDHLRALGPPYFVNQVVQRHLSGPSARKWSKRAGRVTTCETPSHHARRPVGRSRCGTPEPPRRPAPGSRRPERAGPPPTTGSRRSRRPPGAGGASLTDRRTPRRRGPHGNHHHTKRRTRDRPATAPFRPGGAGRLKEKALRVGVGVRPPGAKGDRAAQAASASIRARLPGGARRSSPRPAAEPDGARRRIPTGASRPWTRGS